MTIVRSASRPLGDDMNTLMVRATLLCLATVALPAGMYILNAQIVPETTKVASPLVFQSRLQFWHEGMALLNEGYGSILKASGRRILVVVHYGLGKS
jgi:hypothetical protein